jgi:hypothetical protein
MEDSSSSSCEMSRWPSIRSVSDRVATSPVHVTVHITVHLFSSSFLSGTAVKLKVSIKNLDNGEPRHRQALEPPRGRPLMRATTSLSRTSWVKRRGGGGGGAGAGERSLAVEDHLYTLGLLLLLLLFPPHVSAHSRTSWAKNAVCRGASS